MRIRFLYRQLFGLFFSLSFAIIIILDSVSGRGVLYDFKSSSTTLLICFGFGIFGLIINFLVNMIFAVERTFQR